MRKSIYFAVFAYLLFLTFSVTASSIDKTPQLIAVEYMIKAVNEKNAENYVKPFAENVEIYVGSELKVKGKESLRLNRENHFRQHPDVRSEIKYLVEIDNKVIMHDKVWLTNSEVVGRDIVEIFTFENGKISKVSVIQPSDLFEQSEH